MSKQWYKLVFKQIQPIHIGAGGYGIISETRIFIPGWTMWGALTKAYGLKKNWKENDWENGQNQKLFENISCFYPCFDEKGENVLFPRFEEGEFHLGKYSESEFRAKFVDAFVATAINPGSNTALDESLHETNFILPGAKEGYREKDEEKQLYWTGVVKLENEVVKEGFEIFVGGESKYGFGKMELVMIEALNNLDKNLKDWKNRGGYVRFDKQQYEHGKLELLVEIEKSWEKAGLTVKPKGFYFIPGSTVDGEEFKGFKKGILE